MRTMFVDPHLLEVPPIRVTNYMTEEQQELFRSTIAARGLDEMPLVALDGEHLWIVDGKNRVQEAITRGFTRIQIAVREMDYAEMLMANLVTATMRGKPKLGEVVQVLSELYHAQNLPLEDIYKRTGLPERYVDDLLIISEGGPALMAAVDNEQIGKTNALIIAGITDPGMRDRIISQQISYQWTVEQLKLVIKEAMEAQARAGQPQQEPEPLPAPEVLCSYCGQGFDLTHIKSIMVCPGCDGLLYTVTHQPTATPTP